MKRNGGRLDPNSRKFLAGCQPDQGEFMTNREAVLSERPTQHLDRRSTSFQATGVLLTAIARRLPSHRQRSREFCSARQERSIPSQLDSYLR